MSAEMNASTRRAVGRLGRIAAHVEPATSGQLAASATGATRVVSQQPPVTILVTGAAGQIAYSLVFLVAQVNPLSALAHTRSLCVT
jgi:hypothetical protein